MGAFLRKNYWDLAGRRVRHPDPRRNPDQLIIARAKPYGRPIAAPDSGPKGGGGEEGPRVPRQSGDPSRWNRRMALRTDYWNPPTSDRQHRQQRMFAVVLAFILAAMLAHAGW